MKQNLILSALKKKKTEDVPKFFLKGKQIKILNYYIKKKKKNSG